MHCVPWALSPHRRLCPFTAQDWVLNESSGLFGCLFSLFFYLLTKTQHKVRALTAFSCSKGSKYASPPLLAEIRRDFLKKQKVESLQIQDPDPVTARLPSWPVIRVACPARGQHGPFSTLLPK